MVKLLSVKELQARIAEAEGAKASAAISASPPMNGRCSLTSPTKTKSGSPPRAFRRSRISISRASCGAGAGVEAGAEDQPGADCPRAGRCQAERHERNPPEDPPRRRRFVRQESVDRAARQRARGDGGGRVFRRLARRAGRGAGAGTHIRRRRRGLRPQPVLAVGRPMSYRCTALRFDYLRYLVPN